MEDEEFKDWIASMIQYELVEEDLERKRRAKPKTMGHRKLGVASEQVTTVQGSLNRISGLLRGAVSRIFKSK